MQNEQFLDLRLQWKKKVIGFKPAVGVGKLDEGQAIW